MSGRYRVVQWATGNIGLRALREVIRHPALDLAGVLVYDPAKNGVDAGVLCGEEPVGVAATTDPAAIHGLDADCALYMPRALDVDDVVTLLAAGTNVVTTRGEFFANGHALGDERRARVVVACARGGSSIYSTGSSPGFITDALPFALLVDAAPRRVGGDRGVRELVAPRLARPAVHADGVRAARRLVRPATRRSTSSASSGPRSGYWPRPPAVSSTNGRPKVRSRPRAGPRRSRPV